MSQPSIYTGKQQVFMVVSIGHTLEKEKSVGIYRSRLAEWMVKESIVTLTDNYTTCTVITTTDSDDSGRW